MSGSPVGKEIASVRPMTREELDAEGWYDPPHGKPVVLELDDGTKIYASRDPEGNGPGRLFGMDPEGEAFAFNAGNP